MKALTIDQAIASTHVNVATVEVPEWGNGTGPATVCLRACPSVDWDEHETRLYLSTESKDPTVNRGYRARLVAACWCDEEGNLANPDPAQVAKLGLKDPAVINRLYERCRQLCSNIEGAAKN